MQKKLTVLFAFAIFVLVVGWAVTPAQAHDCIDQNHKRENHPHCNGDPTPDPDPEPIIEDCSEIFCIADVGLDGTPPTTGGRPSNQYALAYSEMPVTRIPSPKFNKILQALTGLPDDALCRAYDVLIFNWGIPKIKMDWPQLMDYMDCGGGIIFEDQNNVTALAPDVSTIEIDRHGRETPILVSLEPVPVLTVGAPLTDSAECNNDVCEPGEDNATCSVDCAPNELPTLPLVNQHIIFAEPNDNTNVGLTPFLRLVGGEFAGGVVGLSGEFDDDANGVFGRIVFSGPDNNWHGIGNSNAQQKLDHTALLFHEINWLLLASCGNGSLDSHLEECDDGNTTDGDECSAVCIIEP